MKKSVFRLNLMFALTAGALCLPGGASRAANDNFEIDVGTSINLGLAKLDADGAFNNPSSAGTAAGLTTLALLEKRSSGNPSDPPQGYQGASAADQTRLRKSIRYIINYTSGSGFYAYADGANMMALALYMRTGGVDKDDGPTTELDGAPLTLSQAFNKIFDQTIAAQRKGQAGGDANNGYWCYYNGGCLDSSTTQLVMAGLSAAKGLYSDAGFTDAVRLAQADAAADLAKLAYRANGTAGGYTCTAADEKGHGYNAGNVNSLQQTASGTWIQLVGGADLNDADVQKYLRWLRNRYRFTNAGSSGLDAYWGVSHWYYLWSSSKAYTFLDLSGVVPAAGNLKTDDLGTLPAASAPACADRQLHRDPAADSRVALFGAGGPGYYDEVKNWYYDYAYTILSYQCATGNYDCNSSPGDWTYYSKQAYALLVLQRSVGGGCIDSDGDGICDDVDNCKNTANENQLDTDGDGVGNTCDNCPTTANPNQADSNKNGIGDACEVNKCDLDSDGDIDSADIRLISTWLGKTVPPAPSAADADNNNLITVVDTRSCTLRCTRPRCATQ